MAKFSWFCFVCILALITLFSSCKKDEYFYMSPDFKSYTLFPVGSYWVYEEVNSGFTDTLTIQDTTRQFETGAESNMFYESVYIDFASKKSGKFKGVLSTITYSLSQCSSYSSGRIYNTFAGLDTTQTTQYLALNSTFFCCCQTGWQNTEEKYVNSKIIDTLTINNKVYKEVMEFTRIANSGVLQPTTVKKSYFARNAGLIKWEMHNGDTWVIVDYKINN